MDKRGPGPVISPAPIAASNAVALGRARVEQHQPVAPRVSHLLLVQVTKPGCPLINGGLGGLLRTAGCGPRPRCNLLDDAKVTPEAPLALI